jgi:MFS family permease
MNNQDNSWKALLSGSNGIKAIALAGGVGLHAINVFLATTILPSVVRDIGGLEFFSWNTTLFVTASIIGSVLSARLLSNKGPRNAYQLSIIIFSLGTLFCALAYSMPIMLIGRFIQGLGGGFLFALSYSMIRLIFEEGFWPRAMALVSGMWGIAALSGPFIGGVFAEFGVWRFSFGSILLISAGLFLVVSKIFPKYHANDQLTPAPPILKLVVLTLATLFVSIGSLTENLVITVIGVLVSILLILLLVKLEKNSTNRILPHKSYLLSSNLGATYAAMSFLAAATAVEIYIPYFLQEIHHYSPLKAGYLTIIMALGWTGASILFSGSSYQKIIKIWHIGPLLMTTGLFSLAFVMPNTSIPFSLSLALICISLTCIGGGIGMGWPHFLTKALSSAMMGEEDQAAASLTAVQLIATAFGAAFTGLITTLAGINNIAEIEGAKNAAFFLFSIFAFLPLMTLLVVRKYLAKKKDTV